jgi:AcrR family transcriptional regulator
VAGVAEPIELPLAAPTTSERERADARRNRERILCAAERLFRDCGVEGVSMDDVAAAAGVGKGTLYRRFGDRSALVRALFDSSERAFQEACIRGEAPLGPGAPARERVHAFGDGMIDVLERHGELLVASEGIGRPGRRYASAPYTFYRTHLAVLLREIVDSDTSADYLADALLAPLAADFFMYQARIRELSIDEIRAGWHQLADAVVATAEQRTANKLVERSS